MFDRLSDTLTFATVLLIALAGAIGAAWWVAAAGATTLTVISLNRKSTLSFEPSHPGTAPLPFHLAASAANAIVFSAIAFLLGNLTTIVWG